MTRKRWSGVIAVALLALLALWWWRGRTPSPSVPAGPRHEAPEPADPSVRGPRARGAVNVRALPRGSIAGTVRDERGASIAGARVCTLPRSRELAAEDVRDAICGDSDAAGAYLLAGLLPARYAVSASAPRLIPARWRDADERRDFDLGAGEARTGIDLVLRSGAVEIRGVVKDIGGGAVADGAVWVRSGGWDVTAAYARTDARGAFVVWGAPGDLYAWATAEGYSDGDQQGVAPGQHLEILLTPEGVLAGRVVEVDSQRPVARALVRVDNDWRDGDSGNVFSDEQGRFRISRLPPGRYKPAAEAMGRYGEARASVLLGLGQTVEDVVIEVHPAFVVAGRIVLADGETPCALGWVSLRDIVRARDLGASIEAGGVVELRAVLPGTYQVGAWCEGHVSDETYPDLTVLDRDVLDQLWLVKDGRAIRGRVVAFDGTPVAGASVFARMVAGDPRGQRSSGGEETDHDGRFAAEGLLPGSYVLDVSPEDQPEPKAPTKVELAADRDTEVTIKLDQGGEIHGAVVDEAGRPVTGVSVRAHGSRHAWRERATTRDDGNFAMRGVPAGEYRVVAQRNWADELRKPGGRDDDVQGEGVAVAAGQVARVRLIVESQQGRITGRILDQQGRPVDDAFVDAEREPETTGTAAGSARRAMRWGWSRAPVVSDPDGAFTIEKLSPGTYTVRAYRRGGGDAFAERVAVGATITLTILATGSIAGTLALTEGPPPEEFTVQVVDEQVGYDRRERFFRTGGQFALDELPAGTFLVSVVAAEGSASETVALGEGEARTGLRLTLAGRTTLTGLVVSLDGEQPLAGMRVMVAPLKGAGGWEWDARDKKRITDATGRFTIERAQTGRLFLVASPVDRSSSEYAMASLVTSARSGAVHDVGTIRVPRRRVALRERGGDLGFTLQDTPPEIEPEEARLIVALVRPGGPAAASGLVAGDEIVSVDGHDVTGVNIYLMDTLPLVPTGTEVTFGLRRGATAVIRAGKPL